MKTNKAWSILQLDKKVKGCTICSTILIMLYCCFIHKYLYSMWFSSRNKPLHEWDPIGWAAKLSLEFSERKQFIKPSRVSGPCWILLGFYGTRARWRLRETSSLWLPWKGTLIIQKQLTRRCALLQGQTGASREKGLKKHRAGSGTGT